MTLTDLAPSSPRRLRRGKPGLADWHPSRSGGLTITEWPRKSKRLISFARAFHNITATDCDRLRRSLIFDAAIKPIRKMAWERARLARGVWRPAKHILDRKGGARRATRRPGPPPRCCGAIKRSRSPDIPLTLPAGATQRAHWRILAQKAESVQPMVGSFF